MEKEEHPGINACLHVSLWDCLRCRYYRVLLTRHQTAALLSIFLPRRVVWNYWQFFHNSLYCFDGDYIQMKALQVLQEEMIIIVRYSVCYVGCMYLCSVFWDTGAPAVGQLLWKPTQTSLHVIAETHWCCFLVGINPDTIKLHEAVNPCNELSANDGNRCVVGVGCTGLSLHAFCCSVELCTFTKSRSSYRRKINIQSHLLCEIGHYGIDSSFTSDKKKKNQPNGIVFFVYAD